MSDGTASTATPEMSVPHELITGRPKGHAELRRAVYLHAALEGTRVIELNPADHFNEYVHVARSLGGRVIELTPAGAFALDPTRLGCNLAGREA